MDWDVAIVETKFNVAKICLQSVDNLRKSTVDIPVDNNFGP